MRLNPFKFGKEVSGVQFYDRDEAFRNLYTRLSGGASNVVMYAPRRYGKTSLVKKLLLQFNKDGVPTVYFDLNRVDSLERFCEEYASALYAVAGRGAAIVNAISRQLSHLHPTISLGGDAPVEIRFEYGVKMTPTSVASVLDLAEKISTEIVRKPLVIALDEFQEIERLSRDFALEGVFRSCIQAHQNARYIFFGSKTHMLKRMFGDRTRPFYKSASTMRLDKPPEAESVEFVKSRFAAAHIGIDDTEATEIVDASSNIPYYLQQLSSLVFESVVASGRDWVEKTDIESAIGELVSENSDYYSEQMAKFSESQRLLVSALASEPTEVFTEEYRRRHRLGGSSTVNTALRVVTEAGIAENVGGYHRIEDPFFVRYLNAAMVKAATVPIGKS